MKFFFLTASLVGIGRMFVLACWRKSKSTSAIKHSLSLNGTHCRLCNKRVKLRLTAHFHCNSF